MLVKQPLVTTENHQLNVNETQTRHWHVKVYKSIYYSAQCDIAYVLKLLRISWSVKNSVSICLQKFSRFGKFSTISAIVFVGIVVVSSAYRCPKTKASSSVGLQHKTKNYGMYHHMHEHDLKMSELCYIMLSHILVICWSAIYFYWAQLNTIKYLYRPACQQ